VAIGQALIHDPEVLMLDEPASGLDPEARHALASLFTRLSAEGMTLLVSSHILAELDEYSTHMLVMRSGRILEARALGGVVANARRLRVEFAREEAGLVSVLQAVPGLRVLETAPKEALVAIADDDAVQSDVLRALVTAGLSVSAFSPDRENLHQSYLRTVAGDEPREAA
jgi:ABC-2 type transport system ATP-binding protein